MVSGGSDSDIVVDWIQKCNNENDLNINYVFCDTGVEYAATKKHIKGLEEKYKIHIERQKASKSIPECCHKYGVPWFSKYVSEMMERLQRHNFKWENEPFEVLIKKYPKCKTALMWWCNANPCTKNGKQSRFNIARNLLMKEFIIANPPNFNISYKCCKFAKKDPANIFCKKNLCDLKITGVRQSEGGIRSSIYKSCFSDFDGNNRWAEYRPIYFWNDEDKKEYEKHSEIHHSDCYSVYGLSRTGCVGCPYNSHWGDELAIIEKYEPKFYKFVWSVFGQSYEYSRQYQHFKKQVKE